MFSGEMPILALTQAHRETAMVVDWTQTIVILICIWGCGLQLHLDLINNRKEMRRVRREFRAEIRQFR